MDPADDPFERLRARLHRIAYRMLGARAEADDVVQDAWLRWHAVDRSALESADAWLVTVTTRLAIDRLRAARLERERYVGIWLPEPLIDDATSGPEQALERAESVSFAFLAVLERLTPEARAAFLLRDVFDADYDDVARTLGKSEAACRQLVSRARSQLRDARPRFDVPPDAHLRLLKSFAEAAACGDLAALKSLLADDAALIGDGGGKVPSFGKPLLGGARIAQLYYANHRRHGDALQIALALVDGHWGLIRSVDGVLESVQAFETDGARIVRIHVQRNPDKLPVVGGTGGGERQRRRR